jgi:hypothetical protein
MVGPVNLLRRIKLRFRQDLRFDPLWIDDGAAEAALGRLGEDWMRQAAAALRDDGLAVLPGLIAPALCETLCDDFQRYARASTAAGPYRDDRGLHERLASFHLVSPAAQTIAQDERLVRLLTALLGESPSIVSSLFFEKGSTQAIHRDTPWFFTNPLNHYFGVWTALEDVHPDAGPLTYFKGGHKVAPDRQLRDQRVPRDAYFARIVDACFAAGLERVELCPRRGDVVIWHPQLPHGGAARRDPARSRRSMVVHYKAASAPIMGVAEFFSDQHRTPRYPSQPTIRLDRLVAIDQGAPRFFHNELQGNFE